MPKTEIIKVQYDTSEAINKIDGLTNSIINNESALVNLKKKLKDGEISQVNYSKSVAEVQHTISRDIQERKKYINVIQAEVGSIKRAKAENQVMREERNKMISVYGKNSQAAQVLNSKIDANTKLIKGNVDAQSRWYMGVRNGINKLLLFAGAITGVVVGLIKFGKNIINATDTMQDKWERAMTVAREVTHEFFITVASGDFSHLLKNLANVAEAADVYAQKMDIIEDRTRSLGIAESRINVEKQKQLKILRDVTRSDDQRIESGKTIIEQENKLGELRTKIAKDALDAKLALIASKGITEEIVRKNLEYYEQNKDVIQQADDYNKLIIERAALQKAAASGARIDLTDINTRIANNDKKIVQFAQMRIKYTELNKDRLDELAQLYKNFYDASASADENTQRTQSRLNSLLNENIEKKDKQIKQADDYNKKIKELNIDVLNKQVEALFNELQKLEEGIDVDIEEALNMDDWKENLEKITQKTQERFEFEESWMEKLGLRKDVYYQADLNTIKQLNKEKHISDEEYHRARVSLWIQYNQKVIDAARQLQDSIVEAAMAYTALLSQQAQEDISVHDKKIEELKDRLDIEKELQEQGEANSVDIVQGQLNEELAARKRAQKEYAKIQKLQARIELAAQAANLITATTILFKEGAKEGGIYGVVIALGAIASMMGYYMSYKAKINAINAESEEQKYAKGTIYVKGKGTGKSDSIPARLSKGERVIPSDINSQFDGISNTDLLSIYKMNNLKLYTDRERSDNSLTVFKEGTEAIKDLVYYHRNEDERLVYVTKNGNFIFKKGNSFTERSHL